jgi:hypothetical protein
MKHRPRLDALLPPGDFEVRHIQPYQAGKVYRCPGCDNEIPIGQGHKVVVPVDDPDGRRHWHTTCWTRAERELEKRR